MTVWLWARIVDGVRAGNTLLCLMLLWGLPVTLIIVVFGILQWCFYAGADVVAFYWSGPMPHWWPATHPDGWRPLSEYLVPSLDIFLFVVAFALSASFVGMNVVLLLSRSRLLRNSVGAEVTRRRTRVHKNDRLARDMLRLTRTAGMRRAPIVSVAPTLTPFACAVSNRFGGEVVLGLGLLRQLTQEQRDWVMAHELAHLRYRDTYWRFVWLGSVRALGFSERVFYWLTALVQAIARRIPLGNVLMVLYIACLIYPLNAVRLGQHIAITLFRAVDAWVSRQCEFRADRFAAQIVTAGAGAEVLTILQGDGEPNLVRLFASHPPVKDRIQRLKGQSGEVI